MGSLGSLGYFLLTYFWPDFPTKALVHCHIPGQVVCTLSDSVAIMLLQGNCLYFLGHVIISVTQSAIISHPQPRPAQKHWNYASDGKIIPDFFPVFVTNFSQFLGVIQWNLGNLTTFGPARKWSHKQRGHFIEGVCAYGQLKWARQKVVTFCECSSMRTLYLNILWQNYDYLVAVVNF